MGQGMGRAAPLLFALAALAVASGGADEASEPPERCGTPALRQTRDPFQKLAGTHPRRIRSRTPAFPAVRSPDRRQEPGRIFSLLECPMGLAEIEALRKCTLSELPRRPSCF
ncbi:hypothetical protein T484DRAFT_1749217 [Baffinella frigidus]|nr:hypothetical protein T484DRAFT_1749217 [Cryptophyta sp. CCMP2293]